MNFKIFSLRTPLWCPRKFCALFLSIHPLQNPSYTPENWLWWFFLNTQLASHYTPNSFFLSGWGGVTSTLSGNLNFHKWYELETFTYDTPWQKKLIDDVIIFVMWPLRILQTRMHFCWNQQNLKNYVISQLLLSIGLTCESFKLIWPPEPKI